MFPAEPRTEPIPATPVPARHIPDDPLPAGPSPSDPTGEIVVTVDGEIDGCTTSELLARLIDALHVAAGRTLVVDLSEVRFMGACGITVLLTIRADALALGIPLAVVADQRAVLRPLQVTAAGHELAIHPTVAATRGGPAP
ncbi:anti-sigma-factor antagonist [Pseudonocardia sediminis]|uniref:Anti-sigma factor antagonist n=1 Tax=Pseudonocardia sediminis TaxID=1397368 RepID=A0A4Q7V092_PSEST|nr:STAS domain-containing protein [Pseudonocardia sediminis]RZT86818.1 anti-sigma-factor antagonist [Pseudonocardia sediminis]